MTDGNASEVVHKAVYLDELSKKICEHTAARGVDLWAVEEMGVSASQWANMTGRDRSTVARNIRRAKE